MKRILLPAFCATFTWSFVSAQERCMSHTITERWLQEHGRSTDLERAVRTAPRGVRKGNGTPTIPVAVHVVWNTAAENVANALITEMIATLNQDYQGQNSDWNDVRPLFANQRGVPDIQFCLAQLDPNGVSTSGITRTQTQQTWFDPDSETDDMKSAPDGIAPWDPDRYLNIWICDISSGATGGLVTTGYAYLPFGGMVGSSVDGVVLDYDHGLGTGARTATHETGHYLGLLHPWGDGGCGSDDGMSDTPVTDAATFSCSNTNLMNCGELTQYENFMDYANCALMFTNEQAAQMNGILGSDRSGLLDNSACGTVINGPCIPVSVHGTADGDYVDGVQLWNISNLGSGSVSGPSYQDYTAQSTFLVRGETYALSVHSGEATQDIVGAWIDYDADHVFDPGELLGETVTSSSFQEITFDLTVPVDATLGATTLRVRCVFPDTGEPTSADPCADLSWGETEDYTVNIEASAGLPASNAKATRVFPNPADEWLRIDSDKAQEIEILDLQGRTLVRRVAQNGIGMLDVSTLTNGQYLLRCSVEERAIAIPFTVQHTP